MVKGFRHIRYREIRPKMVDKTRGAIATSKPKIVEIKITKPESISPTTGKKRDAIEYDKEE